MIKSNYSIDKKAKSKQAIMYASNAIIDLLSRIDKNIIAVSSSIKDKEYRLHIMRNIASEIEGLGKKTALINIDFSNKTVEEDEIDSKGNLYKRTVVNPSVKEFNLLVDELKNKYDVVIVNVPPIRVFSNALQYAKICENIILIEKYLYTRYNEFEETLDLLKQNYVNVLGIITYK